MLEWFRHDVECMADDKLSALVLEFGAEGYAVFFRTLETMYHNNGEPLSKLAVKKVASSLKMTPERVRTILSYAASDECGLLFVETPNGYISDRVLAECEKQTEIVEKMRRLGKASAERRGNASSTERSTARSTARSTDRQQIRQDKNRQDNTESSSYKNDSRLISNKNDSCMLAQSPSASDPVKGSSADQPGQRTVITIISNTGEEVPILEVNVAQWEKAYPSVNVRQELQRIKSWAMSNPTRRKTRRGMTAFVNRWLQDEQDRGRGSGKGSPYSSGIVADGSDQEKYKTGETIASLLRKQQEARNAAR